jgi:putative hemolysin
VILAASFSTADAWIVVVIVVLLVLQIVLTLAETGIGRISVVRAQSLAAADGGRSARSLVRLASEPERFINPLMLTINIVRTAEVFLAAILAYRLVGSLGVVVAFVANVVVFFVLTEALPRTLGLLSPERVALATARPVAALVRFSPLRLASKGLIGLANVIVPGKGLRKGPFVSEQELLGIVDAAVEDEVIEHEERELIESIIEFGDTVAREVMVPRPDMVTVSATATITEGLDVAVEHGYSRLPVVGDGIDDIVGIAYAKDLMRAEREGRGFQPLVGLVRTVHFVPETKSIARLMREMQAGKVHMTVLVDEYGGVAGLVTLEDCIEELVGDIVDEYDTEDADVEHLGEHEYRFDGGTSIDDVNELLPITLPDDDWDTIGGFVFAKLGHVPTEGEQVEHEGHVFVAEKLEGRRIHQVRVSRVPGWEPPGTSTEEDDE